MDAVQRPPGEQITALQNEGEACTSLSSGMSATGSVPAPTTPSRRRTDTEPELIGK